MARGVPAKARPCAKHFKWSQTFVKIFDAFDDFKILNLNIYESFETLKNIKHIKLARGVLAKARLGAKHFKWSQTFVKIFEALVIEMLKSNSECL